MSGPPLAGGLGAMGVTERAAHRFISDLVEDGYVLRERRGSGTTTQSSLTFPSHIPWPRS
jgi:hypothetical protein